MRTAYVYLAALLSLNPSHNIQATPLISSNHAFLKTTPPLTTYLTKPSPDHASPLIPPTTSKLRPSYSSNHAPNHAPHADSFLIIVLLSSGHFIFFTPAHNP